MSALAIERDDRLGRDLPSHRHVRERLNARESRWVSLSGDCIGNSQGLFPLEFNQAGL
jgi:hypothetical protein